jgi:sialate O-acetylesterase
MSNGTLGPPRRRATFAARAAVRASRVTVGGRRLLAKVSPRHAGCCKDRGMKISASFFLATTIAAFADVRLPAIISDHMVLLSDAKANVWGWADAGEKVTVKLGDSTVSATADDKGRWSAKLEGLKPGVVGDMTIAGKNTLTVKNVAAGEVWLASGQSNMEWTVSKAKGAPEEIAACKFPDIRVFTVEKKGSVKPLEDAAGKWEIGSPENAGRFSAVGYFFSRELHQKLKVPVGLVHSSWGGTPVETWIPESGMRVNPAFSEHWRKKQEDYPAKKSAHEAAMKRHAAAVEKAKAEGVKPPNPPRAPDGPDALYSAPSGLFNGMIAPLAPYTIRGAIWYQGESNAGLANRGNMELYGQLFPTMILAWRYEFSRAQGVSRDESEFPFLFVQLANFHPRRDEPSDSYWAQIREAQFGALEVPRTGMAVAIDIGEASDIHPKNKQEVGRRLALSALAQVYFHEMEFSGPLFGGMQIEDSRIRLNFSNANGLKSRDGGPIKGFAVAGEDKKFVWADAVLEGDHVVVASPMVKAPVAVRYGWADNPDCNLVNSAGLPASPFRSDRWPQSPPAGSAATQ